MQTQPEAWMAEAYQRRHGSCGDWARWQTYPPMPMVKARSSHCLPSMMGISRPRYEPGPSRISWVCP